MSLVVCGALISACFHSEPCGCFCSECCTGGELMAALRVNHSFAPIHQHRA